MTLWLLILDSAIAFALFLIGVFILIRNNKLVLNKLFFAFTTSIALWIIVNFLSNEQSINGQQLLWLNKVTLFMPGCAMLFLMMFAGVFIKSTFYERFGKVLLAVFSFIYLLALTPWTIDSVSHQDKVVAIEFGIFGPVYFLILLLNVTVTMALLLRSIRKTRDGERTRVKIITWSSMSAIAINLITNAAIPYFGGSFILTNLGPLSMSIVVVGLFYAITKHQLFDIRLAAARSAAYLLAILALGILYGGVAFTVVGEFFAGSSDISNVERAVFAAVAVLLAITFQPIKLFFDRLTNKLFYRDAYETEAYINDLNHILVSTIEMKVLLDEVPRLIENTLKSSYCEFLVADANSKYSHTSGENITAQVATLIQKAVLYQRNDKVVVTDYIEGNDSMRAKLQVANVAIIGRIGTGDHGELLGYIILGPKKSGNPYNKQDIAVLEATVNELLIAIQNALRFEEIERFNITLQQKVEEATRKLRRTNEKLRQLDETKDDFISMASHQLRTPLTSVKGYVSMVVEGDAGELNGMQKKLLNQAFISAQRMVYLISDLLNVSRLRTGKFIIEPVQSNLANIVQEEVRQLIPTAKGRGLELVYHRPEHFPTLMFDETKMRQVIMNFIDNAIYYTPSGGTITVRMADKPESIEFTVTDTGIGVPKADQHHLFSKFYRANNAKRARPDGTGLGLFMAKKVIVAQGGATIFKSQEGKGSTFGFTFAKEPLKPTRPPESHVLKH